MLISILAAGSRGDVQPYIALGVELKKAGQRVRIVTFKNFENFITENGLEFVPIRGDINKIAASADLRHAGQADNPLKLLLSFKKLQALVFDLQTDFFEACKGSDAIVYHPGAAIGYFIAQQLGIPSILATPFPMTATRAYPALIFYDTVRLGGAFNWATHKIFEQIMWMSGAPVKQFWQKQFGHAPANFGNPYTKQNTSKLPTITSCSNYVFPKPSDWPEHVYNTGYWFLPDDLTWKPSDELRNFLAHGAPPVYVGFGSVGDPTQAEQTTQLVIKALRLAGQRGVLATGWNGMSKMETLPDDIFMLESAPHSWLFPRMAAVVHHGGAGTTAAGLSAGVPSVVIPFSNDQFAWARRVFELGVGPKPIRRKNLSAEKLAQAIQFSLTQNVRDAAQKLGENIQSEDGAAAAAKVILTTLQ